MSDSDVLTEVPEALKRLVRQVARSFYTIEHAHILDLLIHHPCIKEDDLLELTKFDRKQLRGFISTLKQDIFLKTKMRVETDSDGKTTRHNYYFINYSVFVNVVWYKLDNVQKKIQLQETQFTHRASYFCPKCAKPYTELDVGQLMDPASGQLLCTYCRTEVEEESYDVPNSESSLMVKFQSEMEPIFALLKELDGIKLSEDILEPQPKEMRTSRSSTASGARGLGEKWSGENTKNRGFGFMANEVTIDIDGNSTDLSSTVKPKEAPVWMKESTIDRTKMDSQVSNMSSRTGHGHLDASNDLQDSDDIMRTLLSHETKSAAAAHNDSLADENDIELDGRNKTQSQADDDDDHEDESDEDATPARLVTFGGQKIPYDDVTSEMAQMMTPAESEEYKRVGQEIYEEMYGD